MVSTTRSRRPHPTPSGSTGGPGTAPVSPRARGREPMCGGTRSGVCCSRSGGCYRRSARCVSDPAWWRRPVPRPRQWEREPRTEVGAKRQYSLRACDLPRAGRGHPAAGAVTLAARLRKSRAMRTSVGAPRLGAGRRLQRGPPGAAAGLAVGALSTPLASRPWVRPTLSLPHDMLWPHFPPAPWRRIQGPHTVAAFRVAEFDDRLHRSECDARIRAIVGALRNHFDSGGHTGNSQLLQFLRYPVCRSAITARTQDCAGARVSPAEGLTLLLREGVSHNEARQQQRHGPRDRPACRRP